MRQRQPGRSNAEWMELITQCRQSGLSDSMWCEQQGIPASTFYNAVTNQAAEDGMCHSCTFKESKTLHGLHRKTGGSQD